jgi:lipopolysaccharide export system permease protein
MIIFRYLAKEVLSVFAVISLILLLIFLSNQFARYLTMVAAGKLLGMQFIHLLILEIPQLLSLIFPLALYLGILLVYGRLYADSEMVVLSSCGMSQKKLLGMTFLFSTVVAVPVILFTLWINPVVANTRDHLLAQISATSALQSLLPGRFQQSRDGNQIFYIESMSNDRQSLKNVFIAERANNDSWTVMSAKNGYYAQDPQTRDRFVIGNNGYRYEGIPGNKDFTIFNFDQYGVRLNMPVAYIHNKEIDSVPTIKLWQEASSKNLEYSAELQWRLSLPLCVFVLTLIAFSLSHVAPRRGRFSKFFPAILIYIIYANFMIVGQDWISNGDFSPQLGLWILHILMFLLGIGLFIRREGV